MEAVTGEWQDAMAFLRSTWLRVVAGTMLFSAVLCFGCLVSHDFNDVSMRNKVQNPADDMGNNSLEIIYTKNASIMASLLLSSAICTVAFYHYSRLVGLREKSLVISRYTEIKADAIRYSDWMVTLPGLAIEINLLLRTTDLDKALMQSLYWILLLVPMVAFGAYARFQRVKSTHNDTAHIGNLTYRYDNRHFCFLVACLLMIFLVGLIWYNNDEVDTSTPLLFVGPWLCYGAVAFWAMGRQNTISIAMKQAELHGWRDGTRSNTLKLKVPSSAAGTSGVDALHQEQVLVSERQDLFYGLLDIWCKAVLALWCVYKNFLN